MVYMVAVESLLLVVLWVACIAVDVSFSKEEFFSVIYIELLLYIIINGWLVKLLHNEFSKLKLSLLFLTLQIPLFLLGRGAWHGLRVCCVPGQQNKTRRALRSKFSLLCSLNSSTTKFSVEGSEQSLGSCNQSPTDTTSAPVGQEEEPKFTSDAEYGAQTSLRILKTKFVPNTNKIQLNQGSPEEIEGGEPSVYKYTVRCLQMLFSDKRSLSYHIVTDPTNTRILHISCTDKRIGILPDRVLTSGNPSAFYNDTHFVLNLSKVNGYETYSITKQTSEELSAFAQIDVTRLIWLPIWPMVVFKLYYWMSHIVHDASTTVWMVTTTLLGVVTWLVTQRTLHQTFNDRLLLTGLRLSLYMVRTILVLGLGIVLNRLLLMPICYLFAKAGGVLSFVVYLAYMKRERNMEVFREAVDKYQFNSMYDPMVQLGESLVYCIWSIYLYCASSKIDALPFMLLAIIGQAIGLAWLWFVRSRLGQPLRDPVRVLDLIKQMENARL